MAKNIFYFIRGFGSVLALQPSRLPEFTPQTGSFKTDCDAIADDWRKVGADLRWAMGVSNNPHVQVAPTREG
jgi:hypothetical protein